MVILNYEPESSVRNLKGPYVVVIHAEWCSHCKDFMPIYKNKIVPSNKFDAELKDLLTLTSIEDKEYVKAKDIFGEIDGYPTVRYITFDENGKPFKDNNGAIIKIDAVNIPRKAVPITNWINTIVKHDVKKRKRQHARQHAHKKHNKNAQTAQTIDIDIGDVRSMGMGGGKTKRVKRTKRIKRTKKTKKVKRA
jgi:thiol-disulfide isomerase/thioredoxin